MMKTKILALVAVTYVGSTGLSHASEAGVPTSLSVTSNLTVASQYVSRGIRQTWGRPAAQGGIDVVHSSGWSAGFWASSVDSRFVEKGKVEVDIYGGYSGSAGDVGYTASAYVYRYPGAVVSATGTRYDYGELSAGLTWKALYAKVNYTYTRDFFGIADARGTTYLDLGWSRDLGGGYALQLHAGDARVAGAGNHIWDWRDVRAGVSRSFGAGWSASVSVSAAKGRTDGYRNYSTGVPFRSGQPAVSDAARTSIAFSITRSS